MAGRGIDFAQPRVVCGLSTLSLSLSFFLLAQMQKNTALAKCNAHESRGGGGG
jgi:hypothetical protein